MQNYWTLFFRDWCSNNRKKCFHPFMKLSFSNTTSLTKMFTMDREKKKLLAFKSIGCRCDFLPWWRFLPQWRSFHQTLRRNWPGRHCLGQSSAFQQAMVLDHWILWIFDHFLPFGDEYVHVELYNMSTRYINMLPSTPPHCNDCKALMTLWLKSPSLTSCWSFHLQQRNMRIKEKNCGRPSKRWIPSMRRHAKWNVTTNCTVLLIFLVIPDVSSYLEIAENWKAQLAGHGHLHYPPSANFQVNFVVVDRLILQRWANAHKSKSLMDLMACSNSETFVRIGEEVWQTWDLYWL